MSQPSKEPARVQAMFSDISPHYDFMNGLMTAGRHHAWRRAAAREAARDLAGGGVALDACTGTADFALALRQAAPDARIVGTDFSGDMLRLGKGKTDGDARTAFARADTLRLPFRDGAFRAVTIGWGIRNVQDTAGGLRELARVLVPGGRLHVLESSVPRSALGRLGFRVYFLGLVPWLGRLFSRSTHDAYSYLPRSVFHWPSPEKFADLMRDCGFRDVSFRTFAFGGVTLHTGTR